MTTVKKFVVNPLQENTFLLYDDSKKSVIIDPGHFYPEEKEELKSFLSDNQLELVKIINTHCHFDHVMGVEFIRNEFGIPFFAHQEDEFLIENAVKQARLFGFDLSPVNNPDEYLKPESKVKFGNSELEIIHVPGHSPGHVALYNRENGFLVAGDILFHGSIGRTDLPGGDYNTLISGIKSKLFMLPDETTVYCGHGPETTIGFEKTTNPFLT